MVTECGRDGGPPDHGLEMFAIALVVASRLGVSRRHRVYMDRDEGQSM